MATPKIRIKRGTTPPTATNLPSSGELAIDTTNKRFYIQADPVGSANPLWMGAEIEATFASPNSASKLTTQKGVADYISGLIGSTIGNVTTTTTQTITGAKTFQTNNVTLDQVGISFKDGGTDTLLLKAPADIASSYTMILPAGQGTAGQVLSISDPTTGELAWSNQTAPISVSEASAGSGDYAITLTNQAGSALFKDFSSGALPTNGPLLYSKNTGAMTINGNLVVNGPVATTLLTPTASVTNGATTITVTSTTGLVVGQEITIPDGHASGATLPAETKITQINSSTQFSISNGVVTASTITGASLGGLFEVATGIIDIGPNGTGNATGRLYDSNVGAISIGGAGAATVTLGNGVLGTKVTGGPTLEINSGSNNVSTLSVTGTTANIANSTATTVNAFGAATSLTIGGAAGTTNINTGANTNTINISTGVITSGTKTINIGTGTGSGGTSTITLGSATSGSTNTITINGVPRLGANYSHSSITDDKDFATKKYVDLAGGLGITTLNSARAVSTTNVTVSAVTTGSSFGGVTLAAGDRVLLVGQTTASQNGTYVVQTSPTGLARPSGAEAASQTLAKNTYVAITEGTGAGSAYTLSAAAVIGTDSQTWNLFSSAPFTVGNGLLNTSGTISVKPSTYITVNTNGVSVSGIAGNGTTLGATTGLTVDGQTTVAYATVSDLNATYNNGAGTLTGTSVAFSHDGVSPSQNTRILVKSQTNPFENGIYSLTTVGSSPSTPWVLTRTSDANTNTLLLSIRKVYVTNGTTNNPAGRIFNLTNTSITTLGTDGVNYVGDSFWEGAGFTPERYFTIGAPSNLTTTIKAKTYIINGTAQASSVAAGSTLTINVGANNATNPILDALKVGMRLTSYSYNSGTYFAGDNLIIDKIDRATAQKTIIVRNKNASASVSFQTGSAYAFTFDGSSSGTENSYANTPHKGILVYKDNALTTASVLGYNTDGNYWSVYNLGTSDTIEYKLATQNGSETLTSKTIVAPTIQGATFNTTIPTVNVDVDLLSGKTLYAYNYGTLAPNTSTKYKQSAIRQDNISLRIIGCANDIMYFAPDASVSLRTGAKVTLELIGTWNAVVNNGIYYAIYQSPNSVKLATSYLDAISGNGVILGNVTTSTGSTEGLILLEDTSLKLGYSNLGSTGSLYLPSGTSASYDKIFGNADDIGVGSNTYTYATGTNSAFIFEALDLTGRTVIGRDTARTLLNINICSASNTTNQIKSIVFDNTSIAKITFTGTLSGNSVLSSVDYITLSAGSTVTSLTSNQKSALNYYHQVLSSSTVGSDTEVRIQMRQTVASATITTGLVNVACIKNYEMYINRQNFSGSVGGILTFAASPGSTVQTGGQTYLTARSNIISAVIVSGNQYQQFIRLDSIPGGELNPLFGSGTNYMSVPPNTLDMTYTQSNTENTTYTGKRILLNTLIDCGSY